MATAKKAKTVKQGESLVPRDEELTVGQPKGEKVVPRTTPKEPVVQKLGNLTLTHN